MNITDKRKVIFYEKDENGNRTGKTVTVLWDGDNRFVGVAKCGDRDNFCKKTGRSISLVRALSALEIYKSNKIIGEGTKRKLNPKYHFAFNVNQIEDNSVLLPEFAYLDTREEA